jgi:hypothetical protein
LQGRLTAGPEALNAGLKNRPPGERGHGQGAARMSAAEPGLDFICGRLLIAQTVHWVDETTMTDTIRSHKEKHHEPDTSVAVPARGRDGVAPMSHAAPWISDRETFASNWVAKVEQELSKKEYRYLFANDPRTPQASILHLLNQAARAQAANQELMAQDFAKQALSVLEEGVRRHYYSEQDVAPIIKRIQEQIPVALS